MPAAIALLATLFVLLLKGGLLVFLLFSQGWIVALGIVLVEITLFVRGINHVRVAVRTRPADVVLDDTGLHVEGGRLHARSIRWIDCKAVREDERTADDWGITLARAVVELRDGTDVIIAEAADTSERESLHALVESVHARLHPDELAPLPPEDHPDLLRCPSCAAPAAPTDADHTTCAYCDASVPIPAPLRERLRATNDVLAASKVSAPLLAKLLDQPSARRATLLAILAGIPIAAMWMLAVFFGFVLYRHHGFRAINAFLLGTSAIVTIVGCYYLVRFWLVNRMALRVITLEFGAFPPAKPGAPYTCRSCSAPLPAARADLLARCAFCNSDNVLGIDLRPRAEGARKQRATLEAAFARRAKDRRTYALRAAIALVVLPLSLVAFFVGAHAATREAKLVVACDRDDVDACIALGHLYLEPDTYDRDAALRVFASACSPARPDACGELGDQLARGDADELARGADLLWLACQTQPTWCGALGQVIQQRHPPRNLPPPLALFHRACDGGSPRGCTLVAIELERGVDTTKDEATAARLYDQSCRQDDRVACAYLAQLTFDGRGVAQDIPRAIAMFHQQCPDGDGPIWRACAGLGRAYEKGIGVPKSATKAFDLLRRSCEYGSIAAACTRVGEIQESQGYLDRAFEHYATACQGDDAAGCLGVASVFEKRRQFDKALNVLRRACTEQRLGMPCTMAAIWLKTGKHGIAVDVPQAAELYDAGCRLREPSACNLGGQLAYERGEHAKVRPLLTQACDLGEASGCNFLGRDLEATDEAAALAAYRRSCELTKQPDDYGCKHAAALAGKRVEAP